MPADAALDEALEPVRDLIEADGGALEVVDFDGATATLRLVLADAECAECVMPRSFLETVALDMTRPQLAGLERISIIDPREPDTEQGTTDG